MAGPTPPTNVVFAQKDHAVQFSHYPGTVAGVSDFDQATNVNARGDFLNGATNNGDQTTFDYVDLKKSLLSGTASRLDFFIESAVGTELLIVLNPEVQINEYRINRGYRKEVHRIVVPAGEKVEYKLVDVNIEGFNIDYNGTFTGAGTPQVDTLIITAS